MPPVSRFAFEVNRTSYSSPTRHPPDIPTKRRDALPIVLATLFRLGVFAHLTPTLQLLLRALGDLADNQTRRCRASRAKLADRIGVSPRHVSRLLRQLQSAGFLRIEKPERFRDVDWFVLLLPVPGPKLAKVDTHVHPFFSSEEAESPKSKPLSSSSPDQALSSLTRARHSSTTSPSALKRPPSHAQAASASAWGSWQPDPEPWPSVPTPFGTSSGSDGGKHTTERERPATVCPPAQVPPATPPAAPRSADRGSTRPPTPPGAQRPSEGEQGDLFGGKPRPRKAPRKIAAPQRFVAMFNAQRQARGIAGPFHPNWPKDLRQAKQVLDDLARAYPQWVTNERFLHRCMETYCEAALDDEWLATLDRPAFAQAAVLPVRERVLEVLADKIEAKVRENELNERLEQKRRMREEGSSWKR